MSTRTIMQPVCGATIAMVHYTVEALIVGLGLAVVGLVVGVPIYAAVNKKWPTGGCFYAFLLVTLFLSGVAFHLIAEWTGVNRWYCTNGNACSLLTCDNDDSRASAQSVTTVADGSG